MTQHSPGAGRDPHDSQGHQAAHAGASAGRSLVNDQRPGYAPPPGYAQQPGYAPPPGYGPLPGRQQEQPSPRQSGMSTMMPIVLVAVMALGGFGYYIHSSRPQEMAPAPKCPFNAAQLTSWLGQTVVAAGDCRFAGVAKPPVNDMAAGTSPSGTSSGGTSASGTPAGGTSGGTSAGGTSVRDQAHGGKPAAGASGGTSANGTSAGSQPYGGKPADGTSGGTSAGGSSAAVTSGGAAAVDRAPGNGSQSTGNATDPNAGQLVVELQSASKGEEILATERDKALPVYASIEPSETNATWLIAHNDFSAVAVKVMPTGSFTIRMTGFPNFDSRAYYESLTKMFDELH